MGLTIHRGFLSICAGVFATLTSLGCVQNLDKAEAPRTVERGKPFAFRWPASQVTIEETVEREGELIVLSWLAHVTPEGGLLRVSFEKASLIEGDAGALAPSGPLPLYHVMPDLLVRAETGELVGVDRLRETIAEQGKLAPKTKLSKTDERTLKTSETEAMVSDRAKLRWAQWTRLVRFDAAPDTESTVTEKAESGDGLMIPVVVKTTHKKGPNGATVRISRSFSGETVTRMFRATLVMNGASEEVADAVEKVLREEVYEAEIDPKTLQAKSISARDATTVHSTGPEAGVHIDSNTERWTFDWAEL